MPLFHYTARNLGGALAEGRLDAGSAQEVASRLAATGVTPVHIVAADGGETPAAGDAQRFITRKPDLSDLTLFARQMYTLAKAGIPLVRGIRGLAESSRNPVLVEALETVASELESGRDLSSALARRSEVFSSLFLSMVRVGESTGRLDEAFLRIAQYLELEKDTRARIKSALRYPGIVLAAIAVALVIINVLVIPAFARIFEQANVDLPWATRTLIGVSDLFVEHWPLMIAALIAAVLGVRSWVGTEGGRYQWDRAKLRLPVVGSIVHRATLGRFARALSLANRSGVPLIQALSVVAKAVDNRYVEERIAQMRTGVERGDTLARTAAATGLFTPLVLQMIAVGEETGAVDELLDEVAGFYEREVDYDLKNLSAAIEPILILAVGIMVLILALGVFLPMWDLASAVGLKR